MERQKKTRVTNSNDNSKLYVSIASRGHIDIIAMHTLVRIEAWSNYSRLFLTNGKVLVASTVLKRLEERLDSGMFIRAHHTHLVNVDHVAGLNALGEISLRNGDHIPIARRRRNYVIRFLRERQHDLAAN